ncbi:UDP-N-acetylmuramate dehydrogenase [Chlorobium sp. N1]|uniref:UDP-N-acetylmuramate dehydrogenase n=1 Tax=Chlorobium sp. N1 TaxID=2491138 RepID=UPI00103D81C5|nr:UDP-N-acetylmuramate dehydrogenase [Chlorobium sp. N1]TCD47437.1 UDP-N-acetylmuramate dehydrogenase [Chlorobium sp. N1]
MSPSLPPCRFERDVALSTKAYYGIGGEARFMAYPSSPAECAALLCWNRSEGLPLAVVGSGSNTIFSDHPFPGTVLSLEGMAAIRRTGPLELFVEAGVENTALAEELLRLGIGGGEWLYRLPGRIGGAVRMNARCFGGEISAVCTEVQVLSGEGAFRSMKPEEVFLGYKETSLMHAPSIVLGVRLRFPGFCPKAEIEGRMREHLEERLRKHHFDHPSCGSVFKNNYSAGRPSGSIFEELGCKGMREGGARVSHHHANFIFNESGATALDVLSLAGRMRRLARERANVGLELELECIGLFAKAQLEACGVGAVADLHDPERCWAGLLEYPSSTGSPMQSAAAFPRILLEGPLTGYGTAGRMFPSGVEVRLEQLAAVSEAAGNPADLFLRWHTSSPLPPAFRAAPPLGEGEEPFTDTLWRYGVSELFIGGGRGEGAYLEFEMAPGGRWVAIRFDAPRRRSAGHETPSPGHWREGLAVRFDEGGFSMSFSYALLEPFITVLADGGHLLPVQCAASTGSGTLGLFPWWRECEEPSDFHRPGRFFPAVLL